MKKNVASQVIGVQMISTAGAAFTGTVSCAVTIDGGTQTAGGGTVTHEGNGFHTYTPTQAETNGDHVAFTFTGTGAVPATVQVYTTFPQTGDSFARIGAPVGASISADVAGVQSDTNDIQTRLPAALTAGGNIKADALVVSDKTGYSLSQSFPANFSALAITAGGAVTAGTVSDKTGYALTAAYDPAKTAAQAGDAMALTAAERNSTADALLGRNVAGGSSAGRLVKEALYVLRNKVEIAAGTLTVYGTDDLTAAYTATVTTTAGNPISAVDPA